MPSAEDDTVVCTSQHYLTIDLAQSVLHLHLHLHLPSSGMSLAPVLNNDTHKHRRPVLECICSLLSCTLPRVFLLAYVTSRFSCF